MDGHLCRLAGRKELHRAGRAVPDVKRRAGHQRPARRRQRVGEERLETVRGQVVVCDRQMLGRAAVVVHVIWRVGQQQPRPLVPHQPPHVLRSGRVAAQQAVAPQLPQVAPPALVNFLTPVGQVGRGVPRQRVGQPVLPEARQPQVEARVEQLLQAGVQQAVVPMGFLSKAV